MNPSVLVVCGCCGRHIRPNEPQCPFCGLTLADAEKGVSAPSPWYAVAAVSASIVLTGCPMVMARYGGPPAPTPVASPTQSARDSRDIYGAPPPRETMQIYGAPPPAADAGAQAQDPSRSSVEAYGAPPPPTTPTNNTPPPRRKD